jgi:hypothetical protein
MLDIDVRMRVCLILMFCFDNCVVVYNKQTISIMCIYSVFDIRDAFCMFAYS